MEGHVTGAIIERIKEERKKDALVPLTMEQVKVALKNNRGNLLHASRELGVTRQVLERKVRNNISLKKYQKDLDEENFDEAEHQLLNQVELGNITAITFILRTKAKERGYTERNVLEHELGEGAMKNSAALIEAMRKGSGEVVDVEDYKWVESEPKQLENQDQTS
jgi:hypothetical protein